MAPAGAGQQRFDLAEGFDIHLEWNGSIQPPRPKTQPPCARRHATQNAILSLLTDGTISVSQSIDQRMSMLNKAIVSVCVVLMAADAARLAGAETRLEGGKSKGLRRCGPARADC